MTPSTAITSILACGLGFCLGTVLDLDRGDAPDPDTIPIPITSGYTSLPDVDLKWHRDLQDLMIEVRKILEEEKECG